MRCVEVYLRFFLRIMRSIFHCFVRDLSLAKEKAEILTSHVKKWNLLDPRCKTSVYIRGHLTFTHFYKVLKGNLLCYCSDVAGLLVKLALSTTPLNGVYLLTAPSQVLRPYCFRMVAIQSTGWLYKLFLFPLLVGQQNRCETQLEKRMVCQN